MALSMTGCGEGIASAGGNTCRVELRGVNGKQFKLTVRAREGLSGLESRIEAAVRQRIRRGSVQLTLDMSGPAAATGRRLDLSQLAAYLDDLEAFCSARNMPLPQSAEGLLGLPGTVVDAVPDPGLTENAWPLVSQALDAALDRHDQMRRAEGANLAADMRAVCREIASLADGIRARVPEVVAAYRDRLFERVTKLLADRGTTVGEADIAREVVLVADRTDIAEELVRLASHVDQFDRLLAEDSPGRSLDFLAQELGREANTIASKSLDVQIAHAVVEVKTRIERLREQAQNIE
ncbi:MAG: YicC family protein [Planctomycetia bacterium]|nr:YicC family protein [Planctomycetia bacterium]